MHRRVLIWLLGGIATLPVAVAAQQPKKIPHVVHFSPVAFPSAVEKWRRLLREIGYVEGRNIHFESHDAGGRVDRLPALAEKLAQEGDIDVILAESTPAALAAHRATQTISIVALAAHDPVASGLVQTLAHPGGNVTGISFFASETTAKRVELMREVVPRALRLATVTTKVNEGAQSLGSALDTGRKLGFRSRL
jgi:ABC-type uncharacterized transport system substrate-binding protein